MLVVHCAIATHFIVRAKDDALEQTVPYAIQSSAAAVLFR
jgi:hypothetical protein